MIFDCSSKIRTNWLVFMVQNAFDTKHYCSEINKTNNNHITAYVIENVLRVFPSKIKKNKKKKKEKN